MGGPVPGCGEIQWWHAPDLQVLRERHGNVEHMIVQFDFMMKAWLRPRAEYYIPGASKKLNGNGGFADVVSLTTQQIWEIKPQKDSAKAKSEAMHYAKYAKVCGPDWKAGVLYRPFQENPVFVMPGPPRAELYVEQEKGQDGAIGYYWTIDGKKVTALDPKLARFLRYAVVEKFFGRPELVTPLPDAKPSELPPLKWKEPVFQPGGLLEQLGKVGARFLEEIKRERCPRLPDNHAVAVMLTRQTVDAMFQRVEQQIELFKVLPRDEVSPFLNPKYIRIAAILALPLGVVEAVLVVLGAVTAIVFGGHVAGEGAATADATGAVVAAELRAAIRLALTQAGRAALVTASACIVFMFESSARAAMPGGQLQLPETCVPRYELLRPVAAQLVRLGQSVTIGKQEWVVVGISTPRVG